MVDATIDRIDRSGLLCDLNDVTGGDTLETPDELTFDGTRRSRGGPE